MSTTDASPVSLKSLDAKVIESVTRQALEDDRFGEEKFEFPQGGEPEAGTTVEVSCVLRKDRAVRMVKGDPISLLLETETIPQFLWPAAAPFAQWIARNGELFKDKTVLEIGSGVGLAGFAAAHVGASRVTLSDCAATSLGLIGATISLLKYEPLRPAMRVAELTWGDEASVQRVVNDTNAGKPFDIVIGCDIFYFKPSLQAGLKTASWSLGEARNSAFYCASFARSERMDDDIETLPRELGWSQAELMAAEGCKPLPVGQSYDNSQQAPADDGQKGEGDDTSRKAAVEGHLRVYRWTW